MLKILLALYIISVVIYFVSINFKPKYVKPLAIINVGK